jgi:hypothetical protein
MLKFSVRGYRPWSPRETARACDQRGRELPVRIDEVRDQRMIDCEECRTLTDKTAFSSRE